MYNIRFHKSLLQPEDIAQVAINIKKVSDLTSYIQNFYPAIDKTKTLLLTQDFKPFPDSWLMQDEIPETQTGCFVVPLVCGNSELLGSITSATFAQAFTRAIVGTVISFALGAVIQAIMPKPKRSDTGITDQDRRNNDPFDGIINTVDSSNSIPLNYGMLRVGGQIISADVNTINHEKGDVINVSSYV
jgi:hypothetical protein